MCGQSRGYHFYEDRQPVWLTPKLQIAATSAARSHALAGRERLGALGRTAPPYLRAPGPGRPRGQGRPRRGPARTAGAKRSTRKERTAQGRDQEVNPSGRAGQCGSFEQGTAPLWTLGLFPGGSCHTRRAPLLFPSSRRLRAYYRPSPSADGLAKAKIIKHACNMCLISWCAPCAPAAGSGEWPLATAVLPQPYRPPLARCGRSQQSVHHQCPKARSPQRCLKTLPPGPALIDGLPRPLQHLLLVGAPTPSVVGSPGP